MSHHRLHFTRPSLGSFHIHGDDLIGVFSPSRPPSGLDDAAIAKRIAAPCCGPGLPDRLRGGERVLVVTDDNTRPTPLHRLLPPVLQALTKAGVPDDRITFLVGLGTHRPMTPDEIRAKFGRDIAGRYRILNHAWNEAASLVRLGTLDTGLEVVIHRAAVEADVILAMGNIIPHATAGFSGGGKAVMPGICGESTIADTHWAALAYAMREILGKEENDVRSAVREVCAMVGLSFIVDAVMVGETVADVVAGDPLGAHHQGVQTSRRLYGVEVDEPADVVVAEAWPTDIDLRQAIKAVCAADVVVRDGGVIVLAAECPEGVSPQFPDFEERGFRDPEALFADVEAGRFRNKLLAYTLVAIGRIVCQRASGILVSPHISKEAAEAMGFEYAPNLDRAVALARDMAGSPCRVSVLKNAGELLPIPRWTEP